MRKFLLLLFIIISTILNSANAGFLTGAYSDIALFRTTIVSGTCLIQNNNHEEIGDGDVTLGLENDGTELVFNLQGMDESCDITIRMPLKYLKVTTSDFTLDDGTPFTLYEVKYGNSTVGFVNFDEMPLLIVKHNGRLLNLTCTFKFYDYDWDLKKRKNGKSYRTGSDVELWFMGLKQAKQLGL